MNKAIFLMAILLLVAIGAVIFVVVSTYSPPSATDQLPAPPTPPPHQVTSSILNNILSGQHTPSQEQSSSVPKLVNLSDIPALPDFFHFTASSSRTVADTISYGSLQSGSTNSVKSSGLSGNEWSGSKTFSCDDDPFEVAGNFMSYYDDALTGQRGWTVNQVTLGNYIFHPSTSPESPDAVGYIATDGKALREIITFYSLAPAEDCPTKLTLKVFVSTTTTPEAILGK